MRKAHALAGNKKQELPDLVIYLDSESRVDPETLQHSPYLLIACFVRYSRKKEIWREYDGSSLAEFWRDAARFGGMKKKRVFLYGHNLAYDVLVTGGIKYLCELGFRVKNFYEGGPVFLMKMKDEKNGKTLEFISSTNYYSESLASLGKTFNLDKLDFDYADGSEADAAIYCRRDVEILKVAVEAFRNFVKTENLGNLAKTAAGQAFNAFRHRFMTDKILIHDHKKALELEREAYSGGRVECFRIGNFTGPHYCYDVNSMYPYVMRSYPYPCRLISYRKRGTPEDLQRFIADGYLLVARCHVMQPEPDLGCKLQGKLIFPIGDFWGCFTTPELKYLIERGQIMEVADLSIYEGGHLFADYVDYFYTERLAAKAKGDKVRDKIFKMLLNSLYGKFGQTGETWEPVGDAPIEQVGVVEQINYQTGKKETLKIFGGTVFKRKEEKEAFNSFPAVAAHVTAYARMTLLEYMDAAGRENVLYCDTDSLFVGEKGHKKLAPYHDDKTLGKIKLEQQTDGLTLYAPKDYIFGDTVKMKGVKKGSKQISDSEYEAEIWPHLNSFIRSGMIAGYKNERRRKVLRRQYNKGWVIRSGDVLPLQLGGESSGETWLIDWSQTLYYSRGESLADPMQPERMQKDYSKVYLEQQDRELLRFYECMQKEEAKAFKKALMLLGGVNDPDFESLPRWCKRRKGYALDYLLSELAAAGYYFADSNDLYNALWGVTK